MANNFDSNFTQKVAKVLLPSFENEMVLSKTINTQLLDTQGLGTPEYGDTMKFKRPVQYRANETAKGDLTGLEQDIVIGNASGVVQNMISVLVNYDTLDQAIKLNQLEQILSPAAQELATKLETNLGDYMIQRSGLTYGTPGTAVDAWGDVAGAGSLMDSIGVPMSGERFYVMNPFVAQSLANTQSGLASGSNNLVDTAWQRAQVSGNFGGLKALTSNALSSFTSGALAGESGTLAATPDGTYATHKDSMQQTLQLTGLTISTANALRAGDVIEFTNRYYVNVKTRKTVIGADGLPVKWRATVLTGGSTDGSGNVTVTVVPAALNEAGAGQYDNVSGALTSGDAFTILGAADTEYQPSLFYHKEAFGLGTVKLPKLYATDTIATTASGFSIRVTKFADGTRNLNKVRFDLVPAFADFNPQFAGRGFGV